MRERDKESYTWLGRGKVLHPCCYDTFQLSRPTEFDQLICETFARMVKVRARKISEQSPYEVYTQAEMYEVLNLLEDVDAEVQHFNGMIEWLEQKCGLKVKTVFEEDDEGKYFYVFTQDNWNKLKEGELVRYSC